MPMARSATRERRLGTVIYLAPEQRTRHAANVPPPSITFDRAALSDREAALLRLLCHVAYLSALRWQPETERAHELQAVADAINGVTPEARAKVDMG